MSMNEELIQNANESYRLAEQKAAHYFTSLSEQLAQQTYASTLIKDIQSWKKNHIYPYSLFTLFRVERENLILKGITITSNGWLTQVN